MYRNLVSSSRILRPAEETLPALVRVSPNLVDIEHAHSPHREARDGTGLPCNPADVGQAIEATVTVRACVVEAGVDNRTTIWNGRVGTAITTHNLDGSDLRASSGRGLRP